MQKQAKGFWSLIGRGFRAPAGASTKIGKRFIDSATARGFNNGKPMLYLGPQELKGLSKIKYAVGNQLVKHPKLYGYGALGLGGAGLYAGGKAISDANTPWYGPMWDTAKNYAGKAGDWIKENPGTAGLIGAGLIGIPLLSALFDDDDEDDRPRRNGRRIYID